MGKRREHEDDDDDECFEKWLPIVSVLVAIILLVIFTVICCRSCKRKRRRRAFRSKLLQCFLQIALFMKALPQIRSDYTTARAHKGTPAISNLRQSRKRARLSTLALPTPVQSCPICTSSSGRESYSSTSISTGFPEQLTTRLQSELQQCLKQSFSNKIPEKHQMPE